MVQPCGKRVDFENATPLTLHGQTLHDVCSVSFLETSKFPHNSEADDEDAEEEEEEEKKTMMMRCLPVTKMIEKKTSFLMMVMTLHTDA